MSLVRRGLASGGIPLDTGFLRIADRGCRGECRYGSNRGSDRRGIEERASRSRAGSRRPHRRSFGRPARSHRVSEPARRTRAFHTRRSSRALARPTRHRRSHRQPRHPERPPHPCATISQRPPSPQSPLHCQHRGSPQAGSLARGRQYREVGNRPSRDSRPSPIRRLRDARPLFFETIGRDPPAGTNRSTLGKDINTRSRHPGRRIHPRRARRRSRDAPGPRHSTDGDSRAKLRDPALGAVFPKFLPPPSQSTSNDRGPVQTSPLSGAAWCPRADRGGEGERRIDRLQRIPLRTTGRRGRPFPHRSRCRALPPEREDDRVPFSGRSRRSSPVCGDPSPGGASGARAGGNDLVHPA